MIERSLGWKKDIKDKGDENYRFYLPKSFLATIPPLGDVSTLMPAAYRQDSLGSCVGQATKRLMAYCYRKQNLDDPILSALMLYYLARELENSVFQDSGCTPRDCLKAAAKTGTSREALWPYNIAKFADRPSFEAYSDAQHHKILSYHSLSQDPMMFRGCITAGFPFSLGIQVFDNFPFQSSTGDVPMPKGSLIGGHDIVITGYSDFDRVYTFINSWGNKNDPDGWGMDGYGTLPYAYAHEPELASDPWTARLVDPNDPDNTFLPVAPSRGCLAGIMETLLAKVSPG